MILRRPAPRRYVFGSPASVRGGFTLMEMLISLSITALLMVAMGGAFTAAGSAVEMNDRFFRSMQQARQSEDMIMTLLRRCQAVTSASSTSVAFTAATGDFNGDNLTIAYNSSGQYAGEITMADSTAGTTTVLAANVASATFSSTSGNDMNGTSHPYAVIGLSMTIQIDANQVSMSDSAAPRVYAAALFK